MPKLMPNTLDGIRWGLENFDAIETDIRLSRDNKLIIHHDPLTSDGRLISNIDSNTLKAEKFFFLEELLTDPTVHQLVKLGRSIWIEPKPNCRGRRNVSKPIAETIYRQFMLEIDEAKFPRDSIKILTFDKQLLDPFAVDGIFPAFPILPYINECNLKLYVLKAIPHLLSKSLTAHIKECDKMNYAGLTFAREYVIGPIALRHPSYKKMVKLMDEYNVELGSNLGKVELESEFPKFHRFSDKTHIFPRHAKNGEGQIIAHRGTGTKGVEL